MWIAFAVVVLVGIAIARLVLVERALREWDRTLFASGSEVTLAGPQDPVVLGTGKRAGYGWDLHAQAFVLEAPDRRIEIPDGASIDLMMREPQVDGDVVKLPAGTRFRVILEGDKQPAGGPLRTSAAVALDANVRLFPVDPRQRARFGEDGIHVPGVVKLAVALAVMTAIGTQLPTFAIVAGGLSMLALAWDLIWGYSFLVSAMCQCERDPNSYKD